MTGASLNLAELQPGTRLRLSDGTIVQIVDNPRDGTWLVCCTPDDLAAEELVAAHDVAGLA